MDSVPCPYTNLVDRCSAGNQGHKGPHVFPLAARCGYWLHRQGGPVKCTVTPDYHDGPHEYPPLVTA